MCKMFQFQGRSYCLLTVRQKLRLNVTESRVSLCLMRTLPRSRRFLNKLDDPFQTGGVSDSIFSNSCGNKRKPRLARSFLKPRVNTAHHSVWRRFYTSATRSVLTFLVRVFNTLLPGERTRRNKAKTKQGQQQ